MTLPSKELIISVLNLPRDEVKIITYYGENEILINGTILKDGKTKTIARIFNIYELANECKEWAFDKEYVLVSFCESKNLWSCDIEKINQHGNLMDYFQADTEPEAIFKTCEWIFKQTKGA